MDSHTSVNGAARYCADGGRGLIEVFLAWCRPGRCLPVWEHLAGRLVIPTHLARVAIALLPGLWRLRPGDELLVPAYNCGSELDPLLRAGLRLNFYRVDARARMDLSDVQGRVTNRTRMVYVTHYFGWPQDVSELAVWCRQRGIVLVEDCAMALFSTGAAGAVGRQGDAAIFSLRKSLPVPDGGLLTLRVAPAGLQGLKLGDPGWSASRALLPLFKRRVLRDLDRIGLYPFLRTHLRRGHSPPPEDSEDGVARPDIPASYYFDDTLAGLGMSRITSGLIQGVSPHVVRAGRRANYLRLCEALDGVPGLQLLYPGLPVGVCPLCMPVLISHGRSRLARALTRCGITAFPLWEGYHRALDWQDFPEACVLKDHVLTLPVDHQLDSTHMAYIAATVRRFVRHRNRHQSSTPLGRARRTVSVGRS